MAEPLKLVITRAGLDALVDAQSAETEAIRITQLGLTERSFVAAPTLTALPGEFKRVATFSGQSVSETIIHMTAQDSTQDSYELRGFALYLDDGTLFASYSGADPQFRKVPVASFLYSVDIEFADNFAGSIEFGDATFLYPPATETVKGVAEIATQTEVDTGDDDQRMITPRKLAARLADAFGAIVSATEEVEGVAEIATQGEVDDETDDSRFVTPLKLGQRLQLLLDALSSEAAARSQNDAQLSQSIGDEGDAREDADTALGQLITALRSLTILGGGLVTGGGNLTANRVLQVVAASANEVLAESISSKVLTPGSLAAFPRLAGTNGYVTIPGTGGLIIQHGRFTAQGNAATSVSWPVTFKQACYAAIADGALTDFAAQDNYVNFRTETLTRNGGTAYNNQTTHLASYIAIGR